MFLPRREPRRCSLPELLARQRDNRECDLSRATFTNVNLPGGAIDDANITGLTIFGLDIKELIRAELGRGSHG
uniref:hypothetical protein n=1 Tax=Sphingomonas bacterium TaxID=1895847 RepID=UPI002630F7B5|nr:hypothetical protein [Sphingomonas bacterium]